MSELVNAKTANESTRRFDPAMIRKLLNWIATEDPVLFATVSAEIAAGSQ